MRRHVCHVAYISLKQIVDTFQIRLAMWKAIACWFVHRVDILTGQKSSDDLSVDSRRNVAFQNILSACQHPRLTLITVKDSFHRYCLPQWSLSSFSAIFRPRPVIANNPTTYVPVSLLRGKMIVGDGDGDVFPLLFFVFFCCCCSFAAAVFCFFFVFFLPSSGDGDAFLRNGGNCRGFIVTADSIDGAALVICRYLSSVCR